MTLHRSIAACGVLAVLLAPQAASAANGNKPRTPVSWSPDACATVVDRSTTPTLNIPYSVPMEESEDRTDDEVDDSRTHQFFAFSRLDFRAFNDSLKLPRWISQADIDRAALVDPQVVDMMAAGISPDDILETTPRFGASDWLRITPDDARVPITDAQAAMGVDWDLSAVDPDVYTVWGYTWEPIINLWVLRPGFVKVIASAAEIDAAGPGIALLSAGNVQVTAGESQPLTGCVDAPAGSTITLEWGAVEGSAEPEWQPLIEDEAVATGMLALDLVLPEESADAGTIVKLRATVTDPSGNSYTTYSPGSYSVMAGEGSGDGSGEGGNGDDDGCGCAQASPSGALGWLGLLGLIAATRQRKRVTPSTR